LKTTKPSAGVVIGLAYVKLVRVTEGPTNPRFDGDKLLLETSKAVEDSGVEVLMPTCANTREVHTPRMPEIINFMFNKFFFHLCFCDLKIPTNGNFKLPCVE